MKKNVLLLLITCAIFDLTLAQGDPKILFDGYIYRNDTGASVYLFNAEQMETLTAKMEKAWLYKEKAEAVDSLIALKDRELAIYYQIINDDDLQIALLEKNIKVLQKFQPRWYQKWSMGFVSGFAAMYLVVRAAAGL